MGSDRNRAAGDAGRGRLHGAHCGKGGGDDSDESSDVTFARHMTGH